MIFICHKTLVEPEQQDTATEPDFFASLPQLTRKFLLYSQQEERQKAHKQHRNTYKRLISLLGKYQLSYCLQPRGEDWLDQMFQEDSVIQAVLSLGGDGTLLEASSRLAPYDVPLIALRSSSYSLGFLCTAKEDELEELIYCYKHRMLSYRSLSRIRAVIIPESTYRNPSVSTKALRTTPVALNDILYVNARLGSTSRYLLHYRGCILEKQMSSGLWVYTPTGATAVAAVVQDHPPLLKKNQLGFVVREANPMVPPSWSHAAQDPPCSQGLFSAPSSQLQPYSSAELLQKSEFALKNLTTQAYLVIDGREVVPVGRGDVIVFQHVEPLQLAQLPQRDKNSPK